MDLFNQLRKICSQEQTALRELLTNPKDFQASITACLNQHARLHSSQVSDGNPQHSLEDLVLDGVNEETLRRIPQNQEHSIVWNIWHLARIEDCTMNTLVAGENTVFEQGNWREQLNIHLSDTGNSMPCEEIFQLSQSVNTEALLLYRRAVGRRTRDIIRNLSAQELSKKVEPLRIQVLLSNGCVRREALGLINYWSNRTIAGLLLMPATRHNLVHLNEIQRLKQVKR